MAMRNTEFLLRARVLNHNPGTEFGISGLGFGSTKAMEVIRKEWGNDVATC